MKETSKMRGIRQARGDFTNFLMGTGIDIGAGDDPLVVDLGTVRAWDLVDGDAETMLGIPNEFYDFVYSSHCLEHVNSVPRALENWSRILKKGGFLYVVIPEYVLYEKLSWPSRFNTDHKNSFSFLIQRRQVQRENHFHVQEDLAPLLSRCGLVLKRGEIEDYGFNYNLGGVDQTLGNAVAQLCFVAQKI